MATVRLDPWAPEFLRDPYPYLHKLRHVGPVCWDRSREVWHASGFRAAQEVLRSRQTSANRLYKSRDNLPPEVPEAEARATLEFNAIFSRMFMFMDPPDHTRLRRLVAQAFTPDTVQELASQVRGLVDSILDRDRSSGKIDLIQDVGIPLPVMVIMDLMGLPRDDYLRVRKWADDITEVGNAGGHLSYRQGHESLVAFQDYLRRQITRRRRNPRDGLLSALLAARDLDDRLSEEELVATAILLLEAGHESMTNLIGNAVHALMSFPSQLQHLHSDPSRIDAAIEECLRFDSPIQAVGRLVLEDMEIEGQHLRKGERILVWLAGANRDPSVFNDPDTLDIQRTGVQHLAFSTGIHVCLGAPLARLQGREVLAGLLRRFSKFDLARPPTRRENYIFRGFTSLELTTIHIDSSESP